MLGQVKIWAVIVCYHPTRAQLLALVSAISRQVCGIIVIDNTPIAGLEDWLKDELKIPLVYTHEPDNVGVATGHNLGIEAAQAQKASHVVLFDQDSVPAADMIQKLQSAIQEAAAQGLRIASAGPFFQDPRDGAYYPFIRLAGWKIERVRVPDQGQWCLADYLITSGCLIPLAALEEVGGMEDALFIDYIDIEWGLRARARGFVHLGVFDAGMLHDLGDPPRYFFGGRLRVPIHSPLRHYYHFRNALSLYSRSYIPYRWRVNDGWRLLLKAVFYSFLVGEGRVQRKMIYKGLKHGLQHISGKLARE